MSASVCHKQYFSLVHLRWGGDFILPGCGNSFVVIIHFYGKDKGKGAEGLVTNH